MSTCRSKFLGKQATDRKQMSEKLMKEARANKGNAMDKVTNATASFLVFRSILHLFTNPSSQPLLCCSKFGKMQTVARDAVKAKYGQKAREKMDPKEKASAKAAMEQVSYTFHVMSCIFRAPTLLATFNCHSFSAASS